MKKPYEAIRIEPISVGWGTGLNLGGKMGATAQGGVVDITKGIGDFSIIVGAHVGATASATGVSATAANYVQFSVYESTAATHVGSAISGATLTLGAATAGQLRGAVDALFTFSSKHTTSEYLTINGIRYGVGTTSADGSVANDKWASAINGFGSCQKLPHYRAWTSAGQFMGSTGAVYLCAEDDQATGLDIVMSAAGSSGIPVKFYKLQGVIDINGHALSTNTPKFLNVVNSTFNGGTGCFYSFLVRRGAPTPAKVTKLNT
jgi:hypothetical protein